FVQRLAKFRDLYTHWKSGRATKGGNAEFVKEQQRALEGLGQAPLPIYDWALLMLMYSKGAGQHAEVQDRMMAAAKACGERAGLGYATRYEIAGQLWKAGQTKLARQLFHDLYVETAGQGAVPPVDRTFKESQEAGHDRGYV